MIETELIAGLYDENDNLIVTYEESGLIADADYTSSSYTTAAGSGYSTFNRYQAAKKVILPASLASIGKYAFSLCSITSITIPESVTSIGEDAFYCCTGLTSITIPNGVTSISKYAFEGCKGLTSVTLPNSVTSIGTYAFYSCTNIETATIPATTIDDIPKNKLKTVILTGGDNIGSSAFRNCKVLTSVTISNSITSISSYAFDGCSSLTSITIPDSVTSVGSSVFNGCSNLTSITIPSSVTSIGSSMFAYCTGLTSITIPSSVTSIGNSAFFNCSNLASITIPDSVTSIGEKAFHGCSSLVEMTIPFVGAKAGVTSSDTYQYPFGYIFGTSSYTGGVKITQTYYGISTSRTTSSTYYIPSSLKSVTVTGGNILYGAFYNCTGLTSITIGQGAMSISEYAFYKCTGLTSVTIPSSVSSIGSHAFSDCSGLKSVTIGNGVTSIGANAFGLCVSLTDVTIPASVTSIGGGAFAYCYDLTSIAIPNSVMSIADSAFRDCSSLKSITIPESVTTIGNGAFYGCSSLRSITIPDSVTSIGASAFYGCSKLTSITIPDNMTSIGECAFNNCSNLASVIFAENSQCLSIDDRTFEDCSSLTSITIPASVTSIGYRAFSGCSNLANIELQSIQSIDSEVFSNCNRLTTLDLPDSLTNLSAQAFSGCTTLQELHVGGGLSELSMSRTGYSNGLYIDLSSAHSLETVDVQGNVYFEPAMLELGLGGQFEASEDGSLYRWNTDLNAWELVRLMPEATVLPSYFENSPVASILAACIDDCHTNMFNKDLVIPDTVKLLDMRPLWVWSENFSDYTVKCRIHLLATSAITLVDSGDRPWRDIVVNVPANLVETYGQTWTESWVQQIVSNDSLSAFVAYNQNLQETLSKNFASIKEATKLQDEIQEQRDIINEQQSLIEMLRAELETTKPVIAHLSYSYDTGTGKWTCDHTLGELIQVAKTGGTIKLYSDTVLLHLSSCWDGGLHFVQVVAPNQLEWLEFVAYYGEEAEGQIPEIWENRSQLVE